MLVLAPLITTSAGIIPVDFFALRKKTILGKMVKHNEYKPRNLTSDRFFWPGGDGQIRGTVNLGIT